MQLYHVSQCRAQSLVAAILPKTITIRLRNPRKLVVVSESLLRLECRSFEWYASTCRYLLLRVVFFVIPGSALPVDGGLCGGAAFEDLDCNDESPLLIAVVVAPVIESIEVLPIFLHFRKCSYIQSVQDGVPKVPMFPLSQRIIGTQDSTPRQLSLRSFMTRL